jgi:uncharacterized protein YwgA
MMNLSGRMGLISKIVTDSHFNKTSSVLGKTAIMKYLYLLQKVYKIPLGYEYSIYTYGPYASEVMSDIDYAETKDIINIEEEDYKNGIRGYSITPSHQAADTIKREKKLIAKYEAPIQQMLSLFSEKNARELELSTTIVYVYSNFIENGWETEEVPDDVKNIKPYFDIQTIKDEYERLKHIGVLTKAVS